MTPEAWAAAREAGEEGRIETALALVGPPAPAALEPAQALLVGRWLGRKPDPSAAIPYLARAAGPEAPPGPRRTALQLLGTARFGLGQPLLAAEAQRTLLALDPEARPPRFQLARCQAALGWFDLARATLRGLAPPLPAAWQGWVEELRRDLAATRREAMRLLARRREAGWRATPELLLALLRCGRVAAAEGLLAPDLASRPRRPTLRILAAALALRRGQAPELPARFEGVPPSLRLVAARLALQVEDAALALAALDGLGPEELGAEGLRLQARAGLLSGRAEAVARQAARQVLAAPGDPWPAYVLLTAELQRGALPVWRHAVPAAPAPLVLVQFWHAAPPPDVAAVMDSWLAHNPGFELARFDAATGRAEVAAHAAPGVLAAYDAAHHPAMQSDILRLVALRRRGGLYVDADEACLRPVPDLAARLPGCLVAAPYAEEVPHFLYNGILLAEAGSPVLDEALALIAEEMPATLREGRRPGISNATGPGLLTRVVARRLATGQGGGITAMCPRYWRSFARTADHLAYKRTRDGNWRLA